MNSGFETEEGEVLQQHSCSNSSAEEMLAQGYDVQVTESLQNDGLVCSERSTTERVDIEATSSTIENGKLLESEIKQEAATRSCRAVHKDKFVIDNMKSSIGVKRVREPNDEDQPSVHVLYSGLTRASKRKLTCLLQQWSEWHALQDSSNTLNESLESGEETYFPAICVGQKNSASVSFWIDDQTSKQQNGFIPACVDTVPLYDRGFATGLSSSNDSKNLEGHREIVNEASRCFNCGSYSHSLKECPRPVDSSAVNSARKQHKSKKQYNTSFRNSPRYYQPSPSGKFDGLTPGALDSETRQLLRIGDLDPPPWLNRMRELGYPPGYLGSDNEHKGSEITIYDAGEPEKVGEENQTETSDSVSEQRTKMTVEFPGINAPIPENADPKAWASAPSHATSHQSSRRPGHSSNRRRFMDDGPPGTDSNTMTSPSLSYSSSPSYGSYDSRPSSGPNFVTPTLSRPYAGRGRSPLVYEDFVTQSVYSSSPDSSYNSSSRHYLSR